MIIIGMSRAQLFIDGVVVLALVAVVLLVAAIAGIVADWLPGRWFR